MSKKSHFKLMTRFMTFVLIGTMVFSPWMTAYAKETSENDNPAAVEENERKAVRGLLPIKTNFYHGDSSASSHPLLGTGEKTFPARYRADEQEWAEGIKVKNQLNTPFCWAFAITTCAEYSYAKETYDELGPVKEISPGHLAYFVYNRQPDPLGNTDGDISVSRVHWSSIGGHPYIGGLVFLPQWSGLCLEEKAPFSNVSDHLTDQGTWDGSPDPYDASLAYDDYVVIENMDYREQADREEIKDMIMKYGAVNGMLQMNTNDYMNEGNNTFYNYNDPEPDHGVVIVGWDDEFPRENFTHTKDTKGSPLIYGGRTLNDEEAAELTTPEGDGAWIIQNSWGDFYDNGFFYVSYYSVDMLNNDVCGFDMMAADTYKYNFFYDGTLSDYHSLDDSCKAYATVSGTKAANVYKNTTGKDITIDAVGFTNYDTSPVQYDISVYTAVWDPSDPESGHLLGKATVTPENQGIHTVKLDKPVYVGKNDLYSVVLSFPDEPCALGVEMPGYDDTYINTVATAQGQSLYFRAGSWTDLDSYNACYRIRAFANPTDDNPPLFIINEPESHEKYYNGTEQYLVDPGAAFHGELYYALGSDDVTAPAEGYSTAIPERKDVGEYYVWYKAISDFDNEEVTEPKCITSWIRPKQIKIKAKKQYAINDGKPITSLNMVEVDGLAEGDKLVSIDFEIEIENNIQFIVPTQARIEDRSQTDVTDQYQIDYVRGILHSNSSVVPVPIDPRPVPVTPGSTPVVVTPEPDAGAVKLREDMEAFNTYKNEQRKYADSLILSTDTAEDKKLIMDAVAAITSLIYDENSTPEQNKKAVDDIITQLKKDLAAQRESEKKTDYSSEWVEGKWYNKDGTQTYKPVGSWHRDKTGWWYEDESGWYPRNRWQKIDGKWYYFKADGYAAAGEYIRGWWLDSKTCQCTYRCRAKWHRNKKGWWYGDASGWYAKNRSYTIDGRRYRFDKNGYLAK